MDIILIAINNIKRRHFNSSIGLGVIYEYLSHYGYNPKCINYFINLSYEDLFNEYSGYVPELINLPVVLTMLKNFRDKKPDLLKGTSGLKPIQLKNLDNVRKAIEQMNIRNNSIIGFSVFSLSFLYSIYCALLIRMKNPSVKIVFGNYHISLSSNVRNFILKSGIADIAVIGDGCETMLKIARGEISNGVVVGEFKNNVVWPLDYYKRLNYTNHNYMAMASVGCPFKCFFCASNRKHVFYDLQNFKNYLYELLTRVKVESIHLVDDEINSSLTRGIEVCNVMKKIKAPWSCFLVPNNVNKELAIRLKEANCSRVFVGADSFYNPRLRYINKSSTEEQNLKTIYTLAKQGLKVTVSSILGFPYEGRRERKHNINVYKRIKKDFGDQIYSCFSIFKLYPGSHFYHNALKYGIKFSYWHNKYQTMISDLEGVISSTPQRFYIPKTNRKQAVKIMRKFNNYNYIPKDQENIDFKEVHVA